MRTALLPLLLALASCGQCGGNPSQSGFLCDTPFAVGPDNTEGICYPGEICLPSAVAPCTGNACCHTFCSISGCGTSNPCLDLAPDAFPDGGPAGCGCTDAGPCQCAGDGGTCMRTACLQVCSDQNTVPSAGF